MAATRVYLVRHGKAEPNSAGGDAARRLTPEGRAAFHALAVALAPRIGVSRVLTSPFVRARETAELLRSATGAPVEEDAALAAGRSQGCDLLALLRRAGPGVAVVGHNPELAEAVAIAAGGAEKVKPGTIAALDLGADGAELAWIEAPTDD